MIILAFAVFGALLGALQARNRKGKPLDIAQYAAVFAMIFAILGVFVTVFLSRGA
ncbi:hypothetical protein [Maritimibacter sp. DP1N21-5]|uniref:hypothetical protein n=1 Tax=Maritimibacter sp. DP1N21-5 TaxID=2836867 RepID=UPI001C447C12|nr:hypothetical protein [Maritimibacter sp. DP1N21-5]MBV7409898.1 hypothetical protein [Maritimibacter sp. DP1N21-5]